MMLLPSSPKAFDSPSSEGDLWMCKCARLADGLAAHFHTRSRVLWRFNEKMRNGLKAECQRQ